MNDAWIADRMHHIDASGIRKAFDMARSMKDPINLSIGLPDFDVAEPVKQAAAQAIEDGFNAYTVTQGIPDLRGKIKASVDAEFGHDDRNVLITSGTSGALLLAICCVVNPGDRGDPLRPLLRDVSPPGHARGGEVGPGRYLPRFPDRRGEGRRRDHAEDESRARQQPRQPDRRGRLA